MRAKFAFFLATVVACGAALASEPARAARLRGFNLLDMFSVDYTSGTYREEDFELIEEWGFNFARLPIDYRFLVKGRDSRNWTDFDEDALGRLDAAVEMGRRHKVHVQLCLHRIPGYCVNPPAEPTDLFSDPEALRVACLHWKTLAKRYKGVPAAELSINLFNEPKYMDEGKYAAVVEPLIAAIREVDAKRPIVVDGIGYGRIVPKSLVGKGVGFSWHCYDPFFVTHHKAPWADPAGVSEEPRWPVDGRSPDKWLAEETCDSKGWREAIASGAPVHVGEFGVWRRTRHEVALALMEDQLVLWKKLGIGWALWNLRGDFGVLDSNRADIKYEDFRGHKLDRKMLTLLQRN